MRYVTLNVKALEDEHPNGTFEAVLSSPRVDRDGEIIDAGAFEPLPASIPIHLDHDMSTEKIVARAVPTYVGDKLVAKGHYGSDPLSQSTRQKVIDGLIDSMSVGFIRPKMKRVDGVPHIVKSELIESSFVTIPSNVDALVLAGKQARHGTASKVVAGSHEERREQLTQAVRDAHPDVWWLHVVATFDDRVVFEAEERDGATETWQAEYAIDDDGAISIGDRGRVEVTEVVTPTASIDDTDEEKTVDESVDGKTATEAPDGTPGAPAAPGAPPALLTDIQQLHRQARIGRAQSQRSAL